MSIKNIQNLMKHNLEYILLSIIILFAFIVRLYKIDSPIADWHSFRQADTAAVSLLYQENGINLLRPRYLDLSRTQSGLPNPEGNRFVEFPLYNAMQAFLADSFGQFSLEVWGRLVSIFWAEISLICLFILGRRFLGKAGGLLAAFFFGFLPYNIYFTRVILPEPMAVAFGLLALVFISLFIDREKTWLLYLSGILLAISLLVKPYTAFFGLAMAYLLWQKYGFIYFKRLKQIIPFLIFFDIVLVPLLLWRIWISQFPEGIPFIKWMFNGDGIRFRPAFWRWIFGERIGRLILGTWGLIPFVLGIIATVKKNLFNIVFFGGMLLYVIVFATANVKHDYYQVFLIPALCLLLAQGSLFLWEAKYFHRTLARFLLLFSIILMLGMGAYQVKEFYKIDHPEIIEAGKALDRIAPKDAIVIAPYNGDTAFLYQTKRRGWPVIDSSVDEIIQKGATFYVSVTQNDTDTKNFAQRFKTIEKTDRYLILDLRKPIRQ